MSSGFQDVAYLMHKWGCPVWQDLPCDCDGPEVLDLMIEIFQKMHMELKQADWALIARDAYLRLEGSRLEEDTQE